MSKDRINTYFNSPDKEMWKLGQRLCHELRIDYSVIIIHHGVKRIKGPTKNPNDLWDFKARMIYKPWKFFVGNKPYLTPPEHILKNVYEIKFNKNGNNIK